MCIYRREKGTLTTEAIFSSDTISANFSCKEAKNHIKGNKRNSKYFDVYSLSNKRNMKIEKRKSTDLINVHLQECCFVILGAKFIDNRRYHLTFKVEIVLHVKTLKLRIKHKLKR